MLHDLLISATGFVCAAGGFVAGVRYSARRVPELLAQATPEQLRVLAHRTAEKRKAAA